jgi:hypothetical protein
MRAYRLSKRLISYLIVRKSELAFRKKGILDVLFQSPRTLLGQDLAYSRAPGKRDLLDRLARADDLPDFGRVLRGDDVEYTGRETGLLGKLRD